MLCIKQRTFVNNGVEGTCLKSTHISDIHCHVYLLIKESTAAIRRRTSLQKTSNKIKKFQYKIHRICTSTAFINLLTIVVQTIT